MIRTSPVHRRLTRQGQIACLASLILFLFCGVSRAQFCDDNAAIIVGNAVGLPGQEVTVELRGNSLCEVTGLGMAIGHDASRVQFVSAEPSRFLTSYSGDALVFLAAEHNQEGFMSLIWAFDLGFGQGLPPRTIPANTVFASLKYLILPNASGQITLRNESWAYGFPRIKNVYAGETNEIEPALSNGSITVGSSTPLKFRRIDANADGKQDLADAIFVLGFLFVGGQPPTCLKAADANDTGRVDLSDAVFILNFLFAGSAVPPAPYQQCGFDPTPDGLSCAFYPSC